MNSRETWAIFRIVREPDSLLSQGVNRGSMDGVHGRSSFRCDRNAAGNCENPLPPSRVENQSTSLRLLWLALTLDSPGQSVRFPLARQALRLNDLQWRHIPFKPLNHEFSLPVAL